MRLFKVILFVLLLPVVNCLKAQKLLINEISQGITGNREFVELVVNGPSITSCADPVTCVDIRGWIFDDNNGYFSGGNTSGVGLATGAIRFSNDPFWSCVPPGTLILIYDVSETNTAIPPQDLSTTDGNCNLVIPITSTLFERHETRPISSNSSYATTGWVSGGLWTLITMQNDNDSFQLRDPANLSTPAHAVSWGNNNTSNIIYFSGSASGLAFQCVNTTSDDFSDQANWTSVPASSQSPGSYNSTENQEAIGAMNPNCGINFTATVSHTDNQCSANCSAKAWVTISGGVLPYNTPVWSNGQVADTARNLCAGSYSVDVSDARGCVITLPFTVTATQISQPVSISSDMTICEGTTVTLTASPVAVVWTPGNMTSSSISVTPGDTTIYTATPTAAGTCYTADSVQVNVLKKTVLTAITITNPSSCGGNDGSIEIGGSDTNPGNLSWTGAASGTRSNVTLPQTVSGLVAGSYTFTFSNMHSCPSDPVTVVLSDPGAPPVPVITVSGPTAFCDGGSVTLTSSIATGNVWSTGETTVSIVVNTSGTYTVSNTNLGCVNVSIPVTITVYPIPTVDAGLDQTICAGTSVSLQGSGANTYSWDNGVIDGQSFIPLTTTTYTLTGTSINGCQATDQVTITVDQLPSVSAGPDQQICAGASITLTGNGASSYTWDHGVLDGVSFFQSASSVTYTVTGTNGNGCINTDQVTVSIVSTLPLDAGVSQAVCAGTAVTLHATGATNVSWDNGVIDGVSFVPTSTQEYWVSATDINGCLNTDSLIVTVYNLPLVDAGSDQQLCQGLPITLSGTGALTYSWDNGVINGVDFFPGASNLYTVIGTDANGCTGTDQVMVTVNPLPIVDAGSDLSVCAGTTITLSATGAPTLVWDNGVSDNVPFVINASTVFTVVGIDANGCEGSDQLAVNITTTLPLNAGNDQAVCDGTSVILSASGASNVSWDNGVTDGVAFTPSTTTTYTVSAMDANGCLNTDQVEVVVHPNPTISAGNDVQLCDGSAVTLSGSGGISYTWNNGVLDGVSFTPTSNGTYTVIGVDANGCSGSDDVQIDLNPLPIVSAGADQAVCSGQQITVQGSGANTYSWDQGVSDGVAFQPLNTMILTLTGTDVNGCTATDQLQITLIDNQLIPLTNHSICTGDTVLLSSGNADAYVWSPLTNLIQINDSTVMVFPDADVIYKVVGIWNAGCMDSSQAQITFQSKPQLNAGNDMRICEGDSVLFAASGAAPPVWVNPDIVNFQYATPTQSGYYVVTNSSGNCYNSDSIYIEILPYPIASFVAAPRAGCVPLTVQFSNLSTGATTYLWDFGDFTTDTVPNPEHTYTSEGWANVTLTVSNELGCSNSLKLDSLIEVVERPLAAFDPSVFQLDPGTQIVSFQNHSTFANTFEWYFGDGYTSSVANPTHQYQVIDTSAIAVMLVAYTSSSCKDTAWVILPITEPLVYYVPNAFSPNGDKHNQGFKPVIWSGVNEASYKLEIFDRWGELVFASNDLSESWNGELRNGQEAKSDVYTWKLKFMSNEDEEHDVTGFVYLLR